MQQHCNEEHGMTPSEAGCWLVDKETGEKLLALSPRAHGKARKEGWYTDEADAGPDKWDEPEEDESERQEAETQRQSKAQKGKTAKKNPESGSRVRILGRDIKLPYYAEVIFQEAVLSLSEYNDTTDATFSKYVMDAMARDAERLELNSGIALAQALAEERAKEMYALQQEQEVSEDGEEVSMGIA